MCPSIPTRPLEAIKQNRELREVETLLENTYITAEKCATIKQAHHL